MMFRVGQGWQCGRIPEEIDEKSPARAAALAGERFIRESFTRTSFTRTSYGIME
jgi:hypothetical protein